MFESILLSLVHAAAFFGIGEHPYPQGTLPPGVSYNADGPQYFTLEHDGQKYSFNLVDPEQAPQEIRDSVMRGFRIMLNPKEYLPNNALNGISCNGCHFECGNTLGRVNGGISLLGVPKHYPKYIARFGSTITLEERIQSCFKRSLNGIEPEINSPEIVDIVQYLRWISKEVESFPVMPWLGLEPLKSGIVGDAARGADLYDFNCSSCHQTDGEGAQGIPPLWGNLSFNDKAGMNDPGTIGAFVRDNMPKGAPILDDQQAADISAYVLSKPRPQMKGS